MLNPEYRPGGQKGAGVKTSVLDSAAQVASEMTLSVNWECFHLIFAYEKAKRCA